MEGRGSSTYQEIFSQPDIWRQTLENLQKVDVHRIPQGDEFDQVLVTGCGSTYYLSIWGARAIQRKNGWICRPIPASELWLYPDSWLDRDKNILVVAISRSGTTSETIAALRGYCQYKGDSSIVVTCYPESELASMATGVIALPLAQEKSIAQTRSFTNMMLGLSFFANSGIPERLPALLSSRLSIMFERDMELISSIAKDEDIERFFFLGSGPKYGLACEAMLKMKEMSLSYSEAYHFLEFRHGPMSMVDSSSLVVGLLEQEQTRYELNVLRDMKKLGGRVLAIGDTQTVDTPDWLDHFIPLELNELGMFGDVLYLPVLQLLAFERALAKGHDPDHPNNLAPVVVLDVEHDQK
jgi:glucosamine--fructose-6-phosphate aminotransferase (isomerizing)